MKPIFFAALGLAGLCASNAGAQTPPTELAPLPPAVAPATPSAPAPAPAPAVEAQPVAPQPMPVVQARTITPGPAPVVQGQTIEPEEMPVASRLDHREVMTRLELGYRGSFIPDPGFDPFSSNDVLPEFYIAATRTLFASGRISFAAGLEWDNGGRSSTVRETDGTSLRLNRLTIPLEGRVHFGPFGYAFARVAPGVAALQTQLTDASSPATLSKTQWLFATDLSAGYAWLVWPRFEADKLTGRLWLQADVGYAIVAQAQMNLGPELGSGNAQRVDGVDLGAISMSGGFFRISAAASF